MRYKIYRVAIERDFLSSGILGEVTISKPELEEGRKGGRMSRVTTVSRSNTMQRGDLNISITSFRFRLATLFSTKHSTLISNLKKIK